MSKKDVLSFLLLYNYLYIKAEGGLKMSFGDRLREARKSKGMSQQELADELGISINSVANYERVQAFLKKATFIKL